MNLAVLVDDNEVDLLVQKRFIELSQFAGIILTITSPQEALNYLQAEKDAASTIIFLDLNMPVMDGFTFMDRFRTLPNEQTERWKVVVLTSSTSPRDKERAKLFKHVVHFMSKPLSKKDLEEIRSKLSLN